MKNVENSGKVEVYSNFSTLNIQVSNNDLPALLNFLLSKQIVFSINSKAPIPNREDDNEPVSASLGLSESEINDIKKVYQKYIVEGVEKIPPTGKEIATELGISESAFKTHFQAVYHRPFYQLYMEKKMELAADLLKKGISAVVVSARIGYSHPIKFSKMFQKHFGITPKKYQMCHR